MSETLSEDDLRRAATRRANAKLGFQHHLLVYVVVNAGLAGLNFFTSWSYPWFLWCAGGWGIGLVAHGLSAYGFSHDRREAMIQAEMERLRRRQAVGR